MKNIEINETFFWRIYNALRDCENILWECDGSTNPENEGLTECIIECSNETSSVLSKMHDIILKNKLDVNNAV